MGFWAALPVIGNILKGVFGLVDQAIEDKDEANKLKAQLEMVFNNSDLTKFTELIRAQASIVLAESKGGWLQRNWRPLLMLMFMVIIGNNYIFFPYAKLFTDKAVILSLPDFMWETIKIGLGGYVVGRSMEKITAVWKGKEIKQE